MRKSVLSLTIVFHVFQITPCPKECKEQYSAFETSMTEGIPEKIGNLRFNLSNMYTCVYSWDRPKNVKDGHITRYQVKTRAFGKI